MKNLNYRNLYEEMTEKEKTPLISTKRKSNISASVGCARKLYTKEVFSDGWTSWICSNCSKLKFTRGTTFKARAQLVDVVVAALDEELSLGLVEKDLVDLI